LDDLEVTVSLHFLFLVCKSAVTFFLQIQAKFYLIGNYYILLLCDFVYFVFTDVIYIMGSVSDKIKNSVHCWKWKNCVY